MEVVIEKTANGYRQTITDRVNGRKRVRKTNNIRRIENLIANLPTNPRFVEVDKKDIKIVYPNRHTLVLKQYPKHLKTRVYESVLDGIDENTPVVKNIKKNNKKLAALALTTVVFASSFIGVGISLGNNKVTEFENQIASSQYISIEKSNSSNNFDFIQPELVSEENFDLEYRINQTKQILNNDIINNDDIPIATRINEYAINKLVEFINSDDGKYFFETAEDFGIDPYTFLSLMMGESSLNHEETIPGGVYYNGFGVGICQLESPCGQEITAFNYSTNQSETLYETMDNAIDKRTNIKMGIMRYQNVLEKYHGNERLALQSYNFGYGLVDLIVQIYADEKGITFDEVVDNFEDTGWLKYVKEASNNPINFASSLDADKYSNYNATIEYLKNWQYGNYGNGDYLKNLYGYYIGIYSSNIIDGNVVQTNLIDNTINKVSLANIKSDYVM